MSLFDHLVAEAVRNQGGLVPLQVVVEKELLHHDILREMSRAGLLKHLTFIGGTCLRSCYGSNRLSEDLDFTGGRDFTRETLAPLAAILIKQFKVKYDLQVEVSEPVKESGNVDTWKIKVITRPQQPHLPLQRIHIDICAIPSYDRQPMLLRNHYGIDMGTSGLIIQAQSREEILADEFVAFALRPDRIKNRDIWDIGWLKQQNIALPTNLVWKKVSDHHISYSDFTQSLSERVKLLTEDSDIHQSFIHEMKRFLPPQVVAETVSKGEFWTYLIGLIKEEMSKILRSGDSHDEANKFRM
ncbi:nucleotidyl transferase AbiEii/AbiGii toxin family protein [Desulfobacterota bacterium M19]